VLSYVVLARKWRPAQFSDIIGQTHIVRTLTNAIQHNRIHQAYLFTGSRGVGKTSMARIFAKVIRCEGMREESKPTENEACEIEASRQSRLNTSSRLPGGEAAGQRGDQNALPVRCGSELTENEASGQYRRCISCDNCSSCKEITLGSSVDVIEIDGASNNGVEAVREIRENTKYMPSSGSRKIYIIDEVHMLSTAAFNALLKTLEEPPAHVIFIFATTEPHKIPSTILSRCQRFDYRRVSVNQIVERLIHITNVEKIQAEPSALTLIARASEGSMRDALSLLDQMIAYGGDSITLQSVRDGMGLIEGHILLTILKAILERKPLDALKTVEQIYLHGQDLRVLARNLIEFLHALLLAKVGSLHPSGIELSEDEWAGLKELKEIRSLEELELIFQVLHHGLEWIAKSPQPRIVLDILLIKCATAEALIRIDASEAKITSQASSNSEVIGITSTSTIPTTSPSAPKALNSKPTQDHHSASLSLPENFINFVRRTRPLLASILEHASIIHLPDDKQDSNNLLRIFYSPQDAYFREQLQSKAYQEQLTSLCKEYFGGFIRLQIELRESGESLAARKQREQQERVEQIREKAQTHPIILEAKSLFGGELGPITIEEREATAVRKDGHAKHTN
jgi:DNA polymerase III subunit gamma/tau